MASSALPVPWQHGRHGTDRLKGRNQPMGMMYASISGSYGNDESCVECANGLKPENAWFVVARACDEQSRTAAEQCAVGVEAQPVGWNVRERIEEDPLFALAANRRVADGNRVFQCVSMRRGVLLASFDTSDQPLQKGAPWIRPMPLAA